MKKRYTLLIFTIAFSVLILARQTAVWALPQSELDLIYKDAAHFERLTLGCGTAATDGENASIVWNYFVQKQLKPTAIAGIMGNFHEETGGSFDPAIKQNHTTKAIPDGGDGVTGYGLAQWTSKGRQAGLLSKIKSAGLEQFYGQGYGHPDTDKTKMKAEDIQKLTQIELDYAWDTDAATASGKSLKDIAGQLNAAASVTGDNGSTVLFHKLFERSADNAAQIQQRVDQANKYLNKYGGATAPASGSTSCDSNSSGVLGGVSSIDDALPWANRFIEDTKKKYNNAPPSIARSLGNKKSNNGNIITIAVFPESTSFVCWGAYGCDECVTLSGWFVSAMTSYKFTPNNGGALVSTLAKNGIKTGKEPRPFSVFSTNSVGGSVGHTGVVLGVLPGGDVIALENNNGANTLKAFRYNIKKQYPDVSFAYVGDKLKVSGLNTGN